MNGFNLWNMMGGDLSGLGDLLTEQQKQAISNQSMLAMASKLLQAGAPSATPTNLGSALGSAMEAGIGAQDKAQQSALTGMLTKQKIQEFQRQQDFLKKINALDAASGQPVATSGVTPINVPGRVGPTQAKADAAQNAPQVSQEQRLYDNLMAKFQLANQYGMSEAAGRYLEQAQKILPREEVTGTPFEVTDANGKPIMVQQYKSGKLMTLAGFGPKREMVMQDVGGQLVAIDKSQVAPGTTYAKTMTPAEKANFGISLQNLGINRDKLTLEQMKVMQSQYDLKETDQGFVYVPKIPGIPTIPATDAQGKPVMGAASGKASEGERNAAGFLGRMQFASNVFNKPVLGADGKTPLKNPDGTDVTYEQAFGTPGKMESILRSLPMVGDVSANAAMQTGRQEYRQAQENWVRANLRKESGAVIGDDEMAKEISNYFPQIGDSPEVIRQKSAMRKQAESAMSLAAGGLAGKVQVQSPQAPRALRWNPQTGRFE